MNKVSFQLYSAHHFPPLERVLELLREAGYDEVEGYGGVFAQMSKEDGKKLKALLDAHQLSMPTAHFGLEVLEDEPQNIADFAKILGVETIYCPYLAPQDRPETKTDWTAFGARVEKAGAPMRDAGFDYGWHNHDFEFQTFDDGTTVLDALLAGGPSLSLEADLAWIVRGGADPLAVIDQYGDRITAVHVKDLAPAGQNEDEDGWADVGHGTMPWKDLMKAVQENTKARHFIVEHDHPSSIERLISRSIASIKSW